MTMKPLFVTIKQGRRDIHWSKLAMFSVAVLTLSVAAAEVVWYLTSHQPSVGAAVVGLFVGLLLVVRAVVRVLTFQEQELETTVSSS
jgi:hypothetical protein